MPFVSSLCWERRESYRQQSTEVTAEHGIHRDYGQVKLEWEENGIPSCRAMMNTSTCLFRTCILSQ